MCNNSIHQVDFCKKVLSHVECNPKKFKTEERITGMLTLCTEVSDVIVEGLVTS